MGSAERPASRMKFFSRRRIGAGEIQALYQQHGPGLVLYACSLLGQKHAAEDVLQQVFMKLLEQNSLPEDPKPYLYRAVRNAALNLMRNENKNVELGDVELWFEDRGLDAGTQMTLESALMQVPAEQRQVLVMHVWGGLTFEEIGGVLAVSANTAASRYRYALQKLRATLQPEDPLCR